MNDSDHRALTFGANGEVTRLEVLRALAWAAPLTTDHLRRMVAPAMLRRHFSERVLSPMVDEGSVTARYQYEGQRRAAKRQPPKRVGLVWSLTERGFAIIATHDKTPQRPAIVRGGAVLGHDLMMGEVITRIIEWTRPILSSIYLEHEERLDESRRRPIADAMLVVRYDPTRVTPGIVPWKNLPPAPGEGVRLYAIEIDRGTEEYEITDAKAVNYQRVRNDPTFYARYGTMFPVVLITVPSEARRARWHAGWKAMWPAGKWLIATEERLQHNEWLEYAHGRERARTFVDSWSPGQDSVHEPGLRSAPATDATTAPAKREVISLDWALKDL